MMEFCSFSWPVSTSRYECIEYTDETGKPCEPQLHTFAYHLRLREPLVENPLLYREFAELPLTEDGILSFADEWGLLLSRYDLGDEADEEEGGEEGLYDAAMSSFGSDETPNHWFKQIRTMKALVRVWDLIQKNDEAGLAKVVKAGQIEGIQTIAVDLLELPDPRPFSFVNESDMPEHLQRLRSGNLREFAKLALCDFVNRQFDTKCPTWLSIDPKTGSPIFLISPENLQAALWFQFADAIAGEKKLRQCARCKSYFGVSEQNKNRRSRKDKMRCSDACRVAACMDRREMAIKLHQQGKSVNEIARKLDVKEESVDKWVKSKKK
jgi:hypothetical protein